MRISAGPAATNFSLMLANFSQWCACDSTALRIFGEPSRNRQRTVEPAAQRFDTTTAMRDRWCMSFASSRPSFRAAICSRSMWRIGRSWSSSSGRMRSKQMRTWAGAAGFATGAAFFFAMSGLPLPRGDQCHETLGRIKLPEEVGFEASALGRRQLLDRERVARLVQRLVAAEALGLVHASALLLVGREDRVVPVLVAQHLGDVVPPIGLALHGGVGDELVRLEEAVGALHGIL